MGSTSNVRSLPLGLALGLLLSTAAAGCMEGDADFITPAECDKFECDEVILTDCQSSGCTVDGQPVHGTNGSVSIPAGKTLIIVAGTPAHSVPDLVFDGAGPVAPSKVGKVADDAPEVEIDGQTIVFRYAKIESDPLATLRADVSDVPQPWHQITVRNPNNDSASGAFIRLEDASCLDQKQQCQLGN